MADTFSLKAIVKLVNDAEYVIKRVLSYESSPTDIVFLHYSTIADSAVEASFAPGGTDYAHVFIYNTGANTVGIGTATGVYDFAIPPGGVFMITTLAAAAITLYYLASGADSEIEIFIAQCTA